MAGLVSRRVWEGGWVGVGLGEEVGARAGVTGVDTLTKSLSDGAWEVAGVSGSDGAAMVEASDCGSGSGSSPDGVEGASATGGEASATFFCSVLSREGRATEGLPPRRFLRRRRRVAARAGNAARSSDTLYHGSLCYVSICWGDTVCRKCLLLRVARTALYTRAPVRAGSEQWTGGAMLEAVVSPGALRAWARRREQGPRRRRACRPAQARARRRVVGDGCTAELVEAIESTAGSVGWDVAVA
jgi:hypothetical protein